jgi:predicted transcriptional regulator
MVTQEEVLRVIAERTREGHSTSYRTLARELDLSEEAVCEHLKRLWRERLIRSTMRPARYKFRLEPGESIRDLVFDLAGRGKERLRWYKERDEEGGWF